ncbi:MAG: cytochrome c biogenesis protein [Candidatus Acidiferrales bacterium]
MSSRNSSGLAVSLLLFLLLGAAGYAALFVAPDERTMHEIQRIFYFHMPSFINCFIAFAICAFANVAYLVKRAPQWDWLAVASAEVGVAFCTVGLITGPIWAHPVWGIWWTWDARLTSTFVLWVLYVALLLLRTVTSEPQKRATFTAIFGIFACLDVPFVYFSIRLFRTQHPQPVLLGGAGSGLDPTMKHVLLLCWAALLLLLVLLIRQRYRLEALRYELDERMFEFENRSAENESDAFRSQRRITP